MSEMFDCGYRESGADREITEITKYKACQQLTLNLEIKQWDRLTLIKTGDLTDPSTLRCEVGHMICNEGRDDRAGLATGDHNRTSLPDTITTTNQDAKHRLLLASSDHRNSSNL